MAFVHWPPRVAVCELRRHRVDTDVRYEAQALPQPAVERQAVAAALEARKSGDLINMQRCERQLEKAFRSELRCRAAHHLPGGSPSQSSLIYRRLRELRRRHPRVKLSRLSRTPPPRAATTSPRADEIIVDDNAIVGSVGVISRGFGYVRQLRKAGVERRVHTAGDSKAGSTPSSRWRRDLSSQRRLLEELHSTFIEAVETGRGDRLNATSPPASSTTPTPPPRCCPAAAAEPRDARRLEKAGAGLFDGSVYRAPPPSTSASPRWASSSRSCSRYGRYVQLEVTEPERPVDLNRLMRWLM